MEWFVLERVLPLGDNVPEEPKVQLMADNLMILRHAPGDRARAISLQNHKRAASFVRYSFSA